MKVLKISKEVDEKIKQIWKDLRANYADMEYEFRLEDDTGMEDLDRLFSDIDAIQKAFILGVDKDGILKHIEQLEWTGDEGCQYSLGYEEEAVQESVMNIYNKGLVPMGILQIYGHNEYPEEYVPESYWGNNAFGLIYNGDSYNCILPNWFPAFPNTPSRLNYTNPVSVEVLSE